MESACKTASFKYHRKIGTSPYFFVYGQHVKHLHPFWSRCWVFISLKDRKGKIAFPRAYKAQFVGYESARTLEPTFKVIQAHPNGTYGKVRVSKNVIFDDTVNFHSETESPTDSDFTRGIDGQERIAPVVPAPMCHSTISPNYSGTYANHSAASDNTKSLQKALPRQDARPVKDPSPALSFHLLSQLDY
jgi:hypothetical protein